MAKRSGKQRPLVGVPESIVLPAAVDGRRHSIATADGGMLCGRLDGVPVGVEAEVAQAAAVEPARDLAEDAGVEVTRAASPEPGAWTGRVGPVR
ncbi:hypothetical protein [Streptomyces sp. NPDC059468]|uniref:hypothetical protein n=1 Tax=Streptomyces sp. NPDC059468 TaxID=3346845 RepID=UPI0036793B22